MGIGEGVEGVGYVMFSLYGGGLVFSVTSDFATKLGAGEEGRVLGYERLAG